MLLPISVSFPTCVFMLEDFDNNNHNSNSNNFLEL